MAHLCSSVRIATGQNLSEKTEKTYLFSLSGLLQKLLWPLCYAQYKPSVYLKQTHLYDDLMQVSGMTHADGSVWTGFSHDSLDQSHSPLLVLNDRFDQFRYDLLFTISSNDSRTMLQEVIDEFILHRCWTCDTNLQACRLELVRMLIGYQYDDQQEHYKNILFVPQTHHSNLTSTFMNIDMNNPHEVQLLHPFPAVIKQFLVFDGHDRVGQIVSEIIQTGKLPTNPSLVRVISFECIHSLLSYKIDSMHGKYSWCDGRLIEIDDDEFIPRPLQSFSRQHQTVAADESLVRYRDVASLLLESLADSDDHVRYIALSSLDILFGLNGIIRPDDHKIDVRHSSNELAAETLPMSSTSMTSIRIHDLSTGSCSVAPVKRSLRAKSLTLSFVIERCHREILQCVADENQMKALDLIYRHLAILDPRHMERSIRSVIQELPSQHQDVNDKLNEFFSGLINHCDILTQFAN
jgi:hypothetical protein